MATHPLGIPISSRANAKSSPHPCCCPCFAFTMPNPISASIKPSSMPSYQPSPVHHEVAIVIFCRRQFKIDPKPWLRHLLLSLRSPTAQTAMSPAIKPSHRARPDLSNRVTAHFAAVDLAVSIPCHDAIAPLPSIHIATNQSTMSPSPFLADAAQGRALPEIPSPRLVSSL